MNIFTKPPEVPLGLGMALMKNPPAMETYSKLTDEQKKQVIGRVHGISSSEEMEAFVRSEFIQ